MSELKPCPFCDKETGVDYTSAMLGIIKENRRLNHALTLARAVIDGVARETNKDFTAINAMIDQALKDGE